MSFYFSIVWIVYVLSFLLPSVLTCMVLSCRHEEKVDPKKVMVGGMPYYVTEDDIHEFFQDCGTISELDCMIFPDTGRFRGIAFITFRVSSLSRIVFIVVQGFSHAGYACDQVTEVISVRSPSNS